MAGETIPLKDIIRARNQRRRELRVTLADWEATVEALLQLRREQARSRLAQAAKLRRACRRWQVRAWNATSTTSDRQRAALAADGIHRHQGAPPLRRILRCLLTGSLHRAVLCYGLPGVGKPCRHASTPIGMTGGAARSPPHRRSGLPPRDSSPWPTVLYTPQVVNTPRIVARDVDNVWGSVFGLAARSSWYADRASNPEPQPPDLVIVDEADRLKTASLE